MLVRGGSVRVAQLQTDVLFICCPQANVNGRVLSQCNIDELKKEMNMNFGDWQLFRATVSPQLELFPHASCHTVPILKSPPPTGSGHAPHRESAAA